MSVERDPADAALDALLRAHAHEAPPPHVDAAILAAAHRAIGSAPHSTESAEATRPWRWWMPIAAAAAIGAVAIGVLQLVPSEHEPTIVTDMPASVDARLDNAAVGSESAPIVAPAAPEQAAPPLTAPLRDKAADRSEAPRPSAEAPRAPAKRERPRAAAPMQESGRTALPEPFPATRDQPAREFAAPSPPVAAPLREPAPLAEQPHDAAQSLPDAAAESKLRSAERGVAGAKVASPDAAGAVARMPAPQAASPAPPALAKTAVADELQVRRAAEWIARIRSLFDAGKLPDAAQELNRFRDAYADADTRLPAELRAWAATVKR